MLRGLRGLPALTTTLAAAMLLGMCAGTAAAATGGAGFAEPAPKHAASAPSATAPLAPTLAPLASIPQLAAGVALRRVSRRAVSSATLVYVSHAGGPQQVRVDVVRLADGLSVFTDERTVAPGTPQKLTWNGRARGGLALDGRYQLRIALADAAGASSTASAAPAGGAAPEAVAPPPGSTSVRTFTFVGATFPVRGPHSFGTGGDAFGAGRAGHVHEGQDVLASCGTPLVAARGGVVVQRAFQALAGNYLVIQDPLTGQSNVYAHLRRPAIVRRGQRVDTGQPIGVVGETGDATACHLHFELWTAPGWYQGGAPIDPLPTLRHWDHLG